MESYEEFTVIIPTLNEEKNIEILINLLMENYFGIKILVVDDGSTDNTINIVRKLSKKYKSVLLLDRSFEEIKGITASVLHATDFVKTKYFIVIDGDLQHPPECIKEISENLIDHDIVVAYRKSVENEWPLHRKLMSKIATNLAKLRLSFNKIKIKDPMSGFFGVKTELFADKKNENYKRFVPRGYKVLFDFLKLLNKENKISEVGYSFGARKSGTSKIRFKHTIYFLKSLFT